MISKNTGGNEIASRLKNNIGLWQPLQKQIIDLVKAEQGREAMSLLVAKETPAWRAVKEDLQGVVKSSEAEAAQDRTKLIDGLDSSRTLAIVLGLLSFLMVAVITVLVARGIFRQVGGEPAYAAASLQRIANGDLTQHVERPARRQFQRHCGNEATCSRKCSNSSEKRSPAPNRWCMRAKEYRTMPRSCRNRHRNKVRLFPPSRQRSNS